jgi:succinylarginine dihydrolase
MRIAAADSPRITGGLTAAYGVVSLAAPGLLARQLKQTDVLGVTPPGLVILSRVLGVRDLGSGLAMALLPPGRRRTIAVAVRVGFDLTDAAVFIAALPDPAVRRKVGAVAVGWAALCAASGVAGAARARGHRAG